MAINLHCVVCNEEIDAISTGGLGIFMAMPAKRAVRPPAYLVHEACARGVAHPDFDFSSPALGREGVA
jgi:hypothetical protein